MAMTGMDIQKVRELARQLGRSAEEIERLAAALKSALDNTEWVGADATRFRNEWDSTHATSLRNVTTALRDAERQANTDAEQQETAAS